LGFCERWGRWWSFASPAYEALEDGDGDVGDFWDVGDLESG